MKKCLLLLVALLTMFYIAMPASADTYTVDELDMTVSIPSRYDVLKPNMDAMDPIFHKYDFDYNDINDLLIENNIYLNGITEDGSEEIIITCIENGNLDFSQLSEAIMEVLIDPMVKEYKKMGLIVTKYEMFRLPQLNYVKIYFHNIENTVSAVQYYTMYDGNALNITLRSYSGELSSEQEDVARNIVESVRLSSYSPQLVHQETAESFSYADPDTNLLFVVPKDWKQGKLSQERETLDVRFDSTEDLGRMILYGSVDLYSQMPVYDQIRFSRNEFNMEFMSDLDLLEELEIDSTSIDKVTLNGIEYYKIKVSMQEAISDFPISLNNTVLLHIDNGWAHVFYFNGTDTNKLYGDFIDLVKSSKYPDRTFGVRPIYIIITVAVVVLMVTYSAIYYKKRHRKIEKSQSIEVKDTQNEREDNCFYCPMCGTKLKADSAFCYKCGVKIEEERK